MRVSIALLALFACSIAAAQTRAIVGGTVHTVGPDGTLEDATILIEGGIITAVGSDVAVPSGATVINASGKIVTPGLFTPYGQLGLEEVGFSAGPNDAAQHGDEFTAAFDVADAYNHRSTLIGVTRIEGVTSALIAPVAGGGEESGHVISGLAAIVSLGDQPEKIDKRAAAVVVNLGESGASLAGESRAAALLILRRALDEALDYGANRAAFQRGQRRDYTHSVADLETLQAVLNGSTPLLVNIDRAQDIEALITLTEEYGIRTIINGGVEAWMVARDLARARIPVIMGPAQNLPGNLDRINARRDAATVLANAGVTIAFAGPQSQTHNARNITQSAGNAVSEGLDWDAALEAITLAPARMFGLDGRIGSVEAGKDADLVIWSDDPLELRSYAETVIFRGDSIEMRSRQTMLRDRYLDPGSETPPAFRPR